MPLEPLGWNIIVIGDWNIAILTPDGVRKHLFRADDTVRLNIELQIDRPGPFRLTHDGITVTPSPAKLEVGPVTPDADQMVNAAEITTRALEYLHLTPISAVGVNFRYRAQPLPTTTLDLLSCNLDAALADANFEIQSGRTVRTLPLRGGVVNIEVSTAEPEAPNIVMNFHRVSSEVSMHTAWLALTRDFHSITNNLLRAIGL